MIHLLNAAVMPHEGFYELKRISPAIFAEEVFEAFAAGNLKHYIGYQNTLDLIADLIGADLGKINIGQTEMENGDTFYVARLRRRVSPAAKRITTRRESAPLEIADFDFYKGKYRDYA